MNEPVNKLVWITCPHCGATFKVGAPYDMKTLKPFRSADCGMYDFECACPKCGKYFGVTYKY